METPGSRDEPFRASGVLSLLCGVQAELVLKRLIRRQNCFYGPFLVILDIIREYGRMGHDAGQQTDQEPQHFLYFFPLPQGHGSFRPTVFLASTGCLAVDASPPTNCSAASSFSFLRWMLRVRSMTELCAAWLTPEALAGEATATASPPSSSSSGSSSQISGCGSCGTCSSVRCMKNSQRMVSSSMRSIMSWNRT